MKLRILGNRAHVMPLEDPDADGIVLTDAYRPIADIVSLGDPSCPECDGPVVSALAVGSRVILRPGAPYQQVRDDGKLLGWIVALDDILAEVETTDGG